MIFRSSFRLNYLVKAATTISGSFSGLRVIVQSDKNPTFLAERIEEFVNNGLKKILTDMSSEEFDKHKKALVALKLEKPKRLSEKFAQYVLQPVELPNLKTR